uniref:Uncharacterized protein n=1 Tax=Arundo donax TaxID=35708 RepID=A0A0A8ZKL3_ARUDO
MLKNQNYETEKPADLKVNYSSTFVVLNKTCIVQLDTDRKFLLIQKKGSSYSSTNWDSHQNFRV